MNTMHYKSPALHWEEALPLGNGRLGAMVYGGVVNERFAFNEDTLWTGEPCEVKAYDIPANIDDVRELIRKKTYTEACRRADAMMAPHDVQAYQLAGDLYLEFNGDETSSDYRRELDLPQAISTTTFVKDGVSFRRESLVSAPHQVMACLLTADTDGQITFSLRADSLMHHDVRVEGTELVLAGRCPLRCGTKRVPPVWEKDGRTGMSYVMKGRVVTTGGAVTAQNGTLSIAGADKVLLLVAIETGYDGWANQPSHDVVAMEHRCDHVLNVAAEAGWLRIRDVHVQDYCGLYERLRLDLGETDDRPTDEILREGSDPAKGTALVNLVFNYGRYLLISCSRPGTQPANLQGIWNDKAIPPWRSDYHININLQMNYWPAETCNLSECAEPLLDYIRDMATTGRQAAQMIYGARGWCMHHASDIWRYPQTAGGCSNFSLWPLGGAWLCQHVWEHFAFSRDREFLRQTMPLLKEAAIFFVDFMVENAKGQLVTSPSCSPENSFVDPETGESVGLCEGSAMDLTIIRELFGYVLEGCELLKERDALVDEIATALARLAKPKIGKDGRMLEYSIEAEEPEPTHRHLSHIYGAYPGWLFTPDQNVDYYRACRKSLDARGDKSTGWAMGWRVALWARFRDGDRALAVIGNLLHYIGAGDAWTFMDGGGLYANLWDAHPPFQIDGNLGVTAGIVELLVQSHANVNMSGNDKQQSAVLIELLPALPTAWTDGSVDGVRARGGFEVDVAWTDGRLTTATIRGVRNDADHCAVRYGTHDVILPIKRGESRELTTSHFG
jgi:alpha-L-fucosidase 2